VNWQISVVVVVALAAVVDNNVVDDGTTKIVRIKSISFKRSCYE